VVLSASENALDRTEKASAVPSAPENALDRTDQASVVPSGSGRGVRKVSVCASVAETIAQVEKNASPDDLIYIGGSTFVVCEAIRHFESL
jgi:hypothetical protein